jgi:hypothetical protein
VRIRQEYGNSRETFVGVSGRQYSAVLSGWSAFIWAFICAKFKEKFSIAIVAGVHSAPSSFAEV